MDDATLIARLKTYVELQRQLPGEPMAIPDLAVEAADRLTEIRKALVHHLDARNDPCQDRGVDWPCDVADALGR
jgi:hypothetical protein